jgi:hypothetical protein
MVIISGRQVEEWKGPKISGTEKTTTHVMNFFLKITQFQMKLVKNY